MKILFFNYEYPPLGGGAANATAYLMREFSNIPDLEVDIVSSSVDGDYNLEVGLPNIRIHKLPIGKNKGNLHYQSVKDLIVYSWKAYWFSRALVLQAKRDGKPYNLSHSFFTVPCGFISLLLKWEFKLPYVVSLRGSDVPGYSNRFAYLYIFLRPIVRLIWRRAAAVVSNSQGLKELALKTDPRQPMKIIYNGVDVGHFTPVDRNGRETFTITPGASRVTHRKGLNYLIEAVAALAAAHPQIRLVVMGDGDARQKLERLAAELKITDRVSFVGRVPREETLAYYQSADLFVLPSLNEGMSNAMLEALASGLPIISTHTGGADELLVEGENGFFIKSQNSDDIKEKIERFLNDSDLSSRLGVASRKRAEAMSWKNVADQYLKLYREFNA